MADNSQGNVEQGSTVKSTANSRIGNILLIIMAFIFMVGVLVLVVLTYTNVSRDGGTVSIIKQESNFNESVLSGTAIQLSEGDTIPAQLNTTFTRIETEIDARGEIVTSKIFNSVSVYLELPNSAAVPNSLLLKSSAYSYNGLNNTSEGIELAFLTQNAIGNPTILVSPTFCVIVYDNKFFVFNFDSKIGGLTYAYEVAISETITQMYLGTLNLWCSILLLK